ncbi:MAG: SDR family oxidoreductase [Candidatus Eremiobacteraeota bacterium]|nr:SDR family oxidoreductase [Candidatus Eremiobacteraeota bacterium]
MKILVTGCTGYIGARLVPRLQAAGHVVRCMARDPRRLADRFPNADVVRGDVFDSPSLRTALADVDLAFYLVHSMNAGQRDFAKADRQAAVNFGEAAKAEGVQRVVYLGGLGGADSHLSAHLRSRQEVGEQLRVHGPSVTEFRAALIIGSGSASFEMIRYLTERLPLMIAPKWVATRCQPIAIADVLAYLVEAVDRTQTAGRMYEIGGTDVLAYRELMLRYAKLRGLQRRIIVVPFFTPQLSSYWIHFVTPIPSSIARPLIEGLRSEVVVRDGAAAHDFDVRPMGFDAAVSQAFDRNQSETHESESTWFDADDVRTLPGTFQGLTQGMLIDRRERESAASAAALFTIVEGLGGKRGWLYANRLWALRGVLDTLSGGIGMRRGRRSATNLRVGDAVDFWRVDAIEAGRLLRLRAEMKLPGRAWLEFLVEPAQRASRLRLTAFFEPRGLLGYLYWYGVAVFHNAVFGGMIKAIVKAAEAAPAP